MISYLMKQIQHINIVRFLMQMLLKQFVNSCFYEKRVIYSNTANSSLVNRKYRIISNVAITIKTARKIKVDNFLQLHVFFVNEVMQKFYCIASNHSPQFLKLSRMAEMIWISYCRIQLTNLDTTTKSLLCQIQDQGSSVLRFILFSP